MPTMNKIRTARSRFSDWRRPGGPGPAGSLTVLRVAVTAFFAMDGFVFAGWVVRIPEVKAQVGAAPAALGLALLGVSGGAVATMTVTGRLCRRFGNHPVTIGCGLVLALGVALPPLTHSAAALGCVLLVFGAGYGGLNVAMNAAAVDLVVALRRPVMPGFHAAYSFGGLAGAALGGLLAPHLSPERHLLLLAAVALAITVAAGRVLLRHPLPAAGPAPAAAPDGPRTRTDGGEAWRNVRWLVVTLGLVAMCDSYGEGAMADWGTLHLSGDLGAGAGLAAAGYAVFALAMAIGRLAGSAALERFGRTRVLVVGALAASAGMLVAALAPVTWLVIAGYAVTGLGIANIFPAAIARAGTLGGANGVALASTFGYGGMLLGPPAIGFIAQGAGLPVALTTVAALAAVAALIAFAVRGADRGGGVGRGGGAARTPEG
ncbi:MFS transporter [Streptantibioticus silvisoli]